MYIIGVTGEIASGKSTVCNLLKSHGAELINADLLGHESYAPHTECFQQLVQRFGSRIVGENGSIDRSVLGPIVFSDPRCMKDLSIVWPAIRKLIIKRLEQLRKERVDVIVVEAAVLLEAGWDDLMQEIWVVDIDRRISTARLMKRNNLTLEDARKRLEAQMDPAERRKRAHRVLSNSGDEQMLAAEVTEAFNDVLNTVRHEGQRESLKLVSGLCIAAVAWFVYWKFMAARK